MTTADPKWAQDMPKIKPWRGSRRPFLSPKFDGHLVIVSKLESGQVTARTRTPTDIYADIRHLLMAVHERVPSGITLAGELWIPGGDHTSVKTAIISRDPKLRWHAFAILGLQGWTPRQVANIKVTDLEETFVGWGLPHIPFQRPHQDCLLTQMEEGEAAFEDYEGFVLRDRNLVNMEKWKPECTIDLVVVGRADGEGVTNCHVTGKLFLQTTEGYPVCNVSGMSLTDELKHDSTVNFDANWKGKVIEVTYQTVTKFGRLRHARFKHKRDDKHASECKAWQDERLIKYWHSEAGKEEMKS